MSARPKVIGLGEVLWDVFPRERYFGGAPANFAFHCKSLGLDSAVISAVGRDELGDEAIRILRGHGLDDTAVERNAFTTGRVDVELDSTGQPAYHFASNVAWDHLSVTREAIDLIGSAHAICFGTLAQREATSRDTIHQLLAHALPNTLRIFDVNLRGNFYSTQTIRESLAFANVLKLNESELPVVCQACGVRESGVQALSGLCDNFRLKLVALTLGSQGSVLVTSEGSHHAGPKAVMVKDTVGAGDAFTAAITLGLLLGLSLEEMHERASNIAAYVCTQAGATPKLPAELLSQFVWP